MAKTMTKSVRPSSDSRNKADHLLIVIGVGKEILQTQKRLPEWIWAEIDQTMDDLVEELKVSEREEKMSEYTICSTMHCYKKARITGVLGKPPFCEDCQKKAEERAKKGKS